MRVLGIPWEEVREARRLDGLHGAIRVEEVRDGSPPKKGWDIHGITDVALYAAIFLLVACFHGAPVLLVAGGAWLPPDPPGPLGPILGWTMVGMAAISLPLLRVSGIGKLDSFIALHGPRRRALFLHRVSGIAPRLLVASIAWGGFMAGRFRHSRLEFADAVLLSLAVALMPSAITALLAWRSALDRKAEASRAVTMRGVAIIGGSVACLAVMFFGAVRIAMEPAGGSAAARSFLSGFAPFAPLLVLGSGVVLWREVLRSFERREIFGAGEGGAAHPTAPAPVPPSAGNGSAFPFPSRRPGSMLGARLQTLVDSTWGATWFFTLAFGIFGVLIAAGFTWSMDGMGGLRAWHLLPGVLCLVPMGGMLHRERAWLLGMDHVAQRAHSRAFVFAIQVPLYCVTGAACTVAMGGHSLHWAMVALMAGIIVFRLGTAGWEELARRTGWRSFAARLPVYVAAFALLLSPMAGARWALVSAGLGLATGFLGIRLESRLIGEKDLLDEMRREAERA